MVVGDCVTITGVVGCLVDIVNDLDGDRAVLSVVGV